MMSMLCPHAGFEDEEHSPRVVSVFVPGDKFGLLYTLGLHERGRSEFVAFGVPKKEELAISVQ